MVKIGSVLKLEDEPTAIILDPNEWMINMNRNYTLDGIGIEVN